MRRHVQGTGIRKWYGGDFLDLQMETLTVLDSFFSEFGAYILAGCQVASNEEGGHSVEAGLVVLPGESPAGEEVAVVARFAGIANVVLPAYLTVECEEESRLYVDSSTKPVVEHYQAKITTEKPASGYIELTVAGGPRFTDTIQDQDHRFITDLERQAWDAKETPTGAQAKADKALADAKTYTDTKKTEAVNEAKTYTDTKAASTLADAKTYAEEQASGVLGDAKTYADTKKTEAVNEAKTYTDTKASSTLADAKTYAEEQASGALGNAKTYADTKKTEANTYTDTKAASTLADAKTYADGKASGALGDAKTYADTKKTEANTYTDTKAASTLADAKTYAEEQASGALGDAKTYADTKKTEANTYTDTKAASTLADAKTYADGKASGALGDAKTYADTKKTEANTYTDTKAASTLADAKTYADTKKTEANTYTDTKTSSILADANTYTDGKANSTLAGAVAYMDSKFNPLATTVNNKVDKVAGMGLSSNDFTTAHKNKLDSLGQGGAGVEYDYIVDSDAKLAALINNANATRVLIRKGKYNISEPVRLHANVLHVEGEPGSEIHVTINTAPSVYYAFGSPNSVIFYGSLRNVTLYVNNNFSSNFMGFFHIYGGMEGCSCYYTQSPKSPAHFTAHAIYCCHNLHNCRAEMIVNLLGGYETNNQNSAFYQCNQVYTSYGKLSYETVSGQFIGVNTNSGVFVGCEEVKNCVADGMVRAVLTRVIVIGFYMCKRVSDSMCLVTGGGYSSEYGFQDCENLTNCESNCTQSAYYNCENLLQCTGDGPFETCRQLTHCISTIGAIIYCFGVRMCMANRYEVSFASMQHNWQFECMDTAEGGWNSII